MSNYLIGGANTARAVQVLGAPEGTDRHHGAPISLSASEDETLEAARAAWAGLKNRTFEGWIAIGKGIRIIRRRANQLGGRKTFQRLMAEQGFRIDGPKSERQSDKTTAIQLLQVMEQETEVKRNSSRPTWLCSKKTKSSSNRAPSTYSIPKTPRIARSPKRRSGGCPAGAVGPGECPS